MRRLIYILTLLGSWNLMAQGKLEVQGHRGARGERPENTLPAFQYALEVGVDTLELDLHATKDNVLVVTHDPFLNPKLCVDAKGAHIPDNILVRSLTLAELQKYDCGALVNPRFPEQKIFLKTQIPTLESVFEMVRKSARPSAHAAQFNIETKSEAEHPEYTPPPREFVKLLLGVLNKSHMLDRVTLQSFDYRTLKIAKELAPALKLSLLIEDRPREPGALAKLVKEYEVQVLSPHFEWLTIGDVDEMHKMNVRVIPWTPNTSADWQRMITIGVDGLITDHPKALIKYLKEKN